MKKIFTFILLCLSLLTLSYAGLTDQNRLYYTLDSVLTESVGTGYTFTNGNSTVTNSTNCGFNTCYAFNGVNQRLTQANELPNLNTTGFSMSFWLYERRHLSEDIFFTTYDYGTVNFIELRMRNGVPYSSIVTSGGGYSVELTGTNLSKTKYFYTTTWKNNNLSLYINGVYKKSVATTGTISSANFGNGYTLGGRTGFYFAGNIDEFSYWSRGLSASEVTTLYNSGTYRQYPYSPLIINSITSQKGTLINNSYYNTTTLNFNVTTNQKTYKKYFLRYFSNNTLISSGLLSPNGSREYSSFKNLTLWQNKFKLLFNATNSNGTVTSSNYTITIDTTVPTITNNMPVGDWYNYTLKPLKTRFVTCTDTNLLWCNISTDTFNKNVTTTNNITYVTNGNKTYTLKAVDLAGNTVTSSGVFRINPYQYFRFQNGTKKLGGYTFGGKSPYSSLNYTRFKVYGDGLTLGSNTLSFIKLGFVTQSFTFTVNTTSTINTTYTVSPAKIRLTFKDKRTGAILSGRNISIQLIGTVGLSSSTTTGYKNLSSTFITSGFYQVLATSTGYTSESVFFDYTNQENLDRTIYMINSSYINLGYVTIQGIDSIGIPVSNCYARALQWDAGSSAFITTSEVITSSDGKGNVYVILDEKSYKFSLTCGTQTVYAPQEIVEAVENGKVIPLILDSSFTNPNQFIQSQITGTITLLSTINSSNRISSGVFTFNNILGTNVIGCAVVYKGTGSTYVEQVRNCNTTVNGVAFFLNFNFDGNYTYKVTGEVNQGYGYNQIDELYVSSNLSFEYIFRNFLIVIPILVFVLAFGLGMSMTAPVNMYVSISLIFISAIGLYLIIPNTISLTSAFVIMAICSLIIWGVSRK